MTADKRERRPHVAQNDEEMRALFAPLRDAEVGFPPGFRARVMRRVRMPQPSSAQRLWNWIATPRTFAVRPVTAALAVAATAAVVLFTTNPSDRPSQPAGVAGTRDVPVEFVFLAPEASSVSVTGDFVDWDPDGVAMRRGAGGQWVAQVQVVPGVHHYVFVVDGVEWRPDPNAAQQVDDGFGQRNSVLLVPEGASSL